jgi:UPF0755 protein
MFKKIYFLLGLTVFVFLFFISVFVFFTFPLSNPGNQVVVINRNESARHISQDLKNKNIIISDKAFRIFITSFGIDKKINPGSYLFDKRTSIVGAAYRLAVGDYEMPQQKILIPEGMNNREVADIIKKAHPDFDSKLFIKEAKEYEGYLFPDTYDLFYSTSTEYVISVLRNNFDFKTKSLREKAENAEKSFNDLVIMASILEGEANNDEDRRIVAGILYKRIRENIPLQVDTVFKYIMGKASHELTITDLKINSPYNVYINLGLPPTPISNPGLEAIDAALYPKETEYLYFLTGRDGKMYYAKTFDEHIRNKQLYLK